MVGAEQQDRVRLARVGLGRRAAEDGSWIPVATSLKKISPADAVAAATVTTMIAEAATNRSQNFRPTGSAEAP